ncbi:hypothetical protein [Chelatococcus reniformis]|uniref:Uncharacterized protein n=1 Tax=Chelatococcus reniformis TaxID=1494448 RepID=A0A916U487_9HYPH|nr:hypothetical protein [Chelatococcus reniformis]GGC58264.1 hypothetical protein GCM10010994_16490 [Chelatococcus reniformis]
MAITSRAPASFKVRAQVGLRGPRGETGDVTPEAQEAVSKAQQWATQSNAEVEPGQGYGAKKYADAAALDADAAQTQRFAAEAARDAVLAAGQMYPDIAAGRATVADGEYFKVIGSGDVSFYLYQRLSSATERLILTQPSSAAINKLDQKVNLIGANFLLADPPDTAVIGGIADAANKVLAYIFSDASLGWLRGLRADPNFDPDLGFGPLVQFSNGGIVIGVGKDGKIRARLDRDSAQRAMSAVAYTTDEARALLPATYWGSTDLSGFQDISRTLTRGQVYYLNRSISVLINRDYRRAALDESCVFIEYVPSHGQSLNQGTTNGALQPTLGHPVAPHNSFCFNTGTIGAFALAGDGTQAGDELDASAITSFEACHERLTARGLSESMGTALMGSLLEREVAAGAPRGVRFYIAHGKGGRGIAEINKGTGWWDNALIYAQKFNGIASSYGKATVHRSLHLEQGQQDRNYLGQGAQTRTDYLNALRQLRSDYDTDIREGIFGNARPILLTIGQLTANGEIEAPNLGASEISLAQLDLVEEDEVAGRTTAAAQQVSITTADYMLRTNVFGYLAGGPHLYPAGYDIKGEYKAKVHDWVFRQNKWWTALRPSGAITRSGAVITIPFYVPVPPLIIDTATLPDFTQFGGKNGFVYRDSNGTSTVASVAIADDGTGTAPGSTMGIGRVQVTLSAIPTGALPTPEYAYVGAINMSGQYRASAWGNLRDSDNDTSRYVAGVTLWNWSVIFKKDVT